MGQSTDAILFYGYCWDDERRHPWEDDEHEDENAEARLARVKGLVEPADPFPETRNRLGQEVHLNPEQQAVVEGYRAFWAARSELFKATGVECGTHCSESCPMPYVAIATSLTRAWRGSPQEISSLATDGTWQTTLDDFCAALGISTDGMRAAWWLVSDWC